MLSYHQKKSFNEPMNLYLQTNQNGEPIIPFHLHVQPKSGLLSGFYDQQEPELSCNGVFTKFVEMTLELQLLVVSFCDRSTLFQLMHTSHLLRIEAQKLFWSDPNVWYQANDAGILGYEYGLNNEADENAEEDSDEDSDEGYEDYYRHGLFVPDWIAPDFLHRVQRLEVLLTSWTYANTCLHYFRRDSPKEELSPSEDDEEDLKPESLEERIGRFWQSLQSFFPGVKHVVLSDDRRLPEPKTRSDIQKLVARCPPEISISVSALYKYDGYALERGLFEQHGNDRTKRTLTKSTAVWNHSKILLPPRVFRGVNDIDTYIAYRASFRIYFVYADRFLRLEAKEREHLQSRNKTMYCQECFDEAPPGDMLRPMTQPGE
ncbi:hypothetical protein BS50DRAFT_679396 [Corynespora cassiicola Philippines]|uniref:Uncharacterized protein n=1 Tax=Corynespora cassiicola Philippines TaxID=1448308 RepID=A0A2T2NC54_CORCC|nr:hypothetical protein BS50DRAFT_679396 [Corynespora cassiicola Philippines]